MAEKEEGASDVPSVEVTGGEVAAVASKKPAAKKSKSVKAPVAEEPAEDLPEDVEPVVALNTSDAAQGRMNASIVYGDEIRRSTIKGNQTRRAAQHEAMKTAGQNQTP